jgi:hypothetical protein
MNRTTKWGIGSFLAALLAWFGLNRPANATPAAPSTRVMIAPTVAGNDSLIVTWTAPAPQGSAVDSYRVTIRTNGVVTVTAQPIVGTRFAMWLGSVPPGQTVLLAVTVAAHNAAGWGPESSPPATISYTGADLLPGAPTVTLQIKPVP